MTNSDSNRAALVAAEVQSGLNFLLALEILESELYKAVLGTSGSPTQNTLFAPVRAKLPAAVHDTLQQIAQHEAAHVSTLVAAGAQNVFGLTAASFDFTGGRTAANNGPFMPATSDLAALLQLLQLVEDIGVRAYKGQAVLLIGQSNLEMVLRIHSVEGRHASRLRRLRRLAASAPVDVRLSGVVRGGERAAAGSADTTSAGFLAIASLLDKAYGAGADDTAAPSEANVTQLGIDVSSMTNAAFGLEAAQEAFDEPLARADVVTVVQGYFLPTIS
jgi:hypothetical protein